MQIRAWNTLHGTMAVHSIILLQRAEKDSFNAIDENSSACKVERDIPTTKYNRKSRQQSYDRQFWREVSDGRSPFADCCIPGSYHLEIIVARGVEKTFRPRLSQSWHLETNRVVSTPLACTLSTSVASQI